ncbi:transposase [Pandoraea sp. NPDC087047]|uniref:transposase n=1 Tax=Pandoraea sp. NPDC087047 TaxID=3364390 RepID=UPI00382644AF
MGITVTGSEAKPGSHKGRPNYDREFRRRHAAAACEPGGSVAKLARDNGINANMLFTWRRRYREQWQAETTSLIPGAVVHETPPQRVAMPPNGRDVGTIRLREPGRSRFGWVAR